jgi:hypothetical protein
MVRLAVLVAGSTSTVPRGISRAAVPSSWKKVTEPAAGAALVLTSAVKVTCSPGPDAARLWTRVVSHGRGVIVKDVRASTKAVKLPSKLAEASCGPAANQWPPPAWKSAYGVMPPGVVWTT